MPIRADRSRRLRVLRLFRASLESSRHRLGQAQPANPRQDRSEQPLRDRDLGHLEDHIPRVVHHLGPDHGTCQQRLNFALEHAVGGKANGVKVALLLQVLVDLRPGEGGVAPKEAADLLPAVSPDDRLQRPCWFPSLSRLA